VSDDRPRRLGGEAPAAALRRDALARLDDRLRAGADPCLATVLVSDDRGARAFMDRKHDLCAEVGIETRRVDLPADVAAERVYRTVDELGSDPSVTALFVQTPLPAHVDEATVRRAVPAEKDVDCFAPGNVGRLVRGNPRVRPVTARAVDRLLRAHGVGVAGRDAVVVGRTDAIGKPLAHALCRRDATVTVCHTRTRDLGARTRTADLLVTAAGSPGLVDGSMVADGVVVVDVSATHVDGEVVGDVDAASVRPKAAATTPVPGGVGPVTMAAFLDNLVTVGTEPARTDYRNCLPVVRRDDPADHRQ
jgi:methylenetetrahydrofolate dehydrogenase (NADP+)/methenyltetrahydrofolate cyclohydrolase